MEGTSVTLLFIGLVSLPILVLVILGYAAYRDPSLLQRPYTLCGEKPAEFGKTSDPDKYYCWSCIVKVVKFKEK